MGVHPIRYRTARRFAPALLLLALATPAPGSRETPALPEPEPASPLFHSRLEASLIDLEHEDRPYFFQGLTGPNVQIAGSEVQTPLSLGLSACIFSGCLASFCTQSGCLGSYCQASGCLGSYCILSGCTGSYCGGSFCIDSSCLASACTQSICVNECEETKPEFEPETE